ncbi:Fur family transcriptional regulator [Candidatus Cloacimonadota bacterium]
MIDIVKILNEHEIAPSIQRIKILEYLQNYKTHPTADMIYQDLVIEIPTLSKTTVYNTLRTFSEKGILTALSLFDNEVRYDFDTGHHVHFKCSKCGKILDLDCFCDDLRNEVIDGNKILEHHVNLKGICQDCLEGKGK